MKVSEKICELAQGGSRKALKLLNKVIYLEDEEEMLEVLKNENTTDTSESIELCDFVNTTVLICQNDQMQGHKHNIDMFLYKPGGKGPGGEYFDFGPTETGDPINDGVNGTPRTGKETRSKNATVRLWKRVS